MMDRFRTSGKWKIQSAINVNFISSKENDDKQFICSKSDNIEIMITKEKEEIIKNFFNPFLLGMELV